MVMNTFVALKNAVKVKISKATIDSPVDRLHYRLTSLLLFGCCLLVTAQQLLGTHIQCFLGDEAMNKKLGKALNQYCFISSTYTVPKNFNKQTGQEVVQSGVGPRTDDDEVVYHAYYQWVPFVLFIQAMAFRLPHVIWKFAEGGTIHNILQGLNVLVLEENKRGSKENALSNYLLETLNSHNVRCVSYYISELLYFVILVGNIRLTDTFLGGEFSTYGPEVLWFLDANPENRTDPMSRVFPRLTKCDFHMYGPSGSIQRFDAMCLLALNIMNEKIYVFLWFWFVVLACITALNIIWMFLTIIIRPIRKWLLLRRASNKVSNEFEIIFPKLQIGDWLLLEYILINMDTVIADEFIRKLAKALSPGDTTEQEMLVGVVEHQPSSPDKSALQD